MAADLHIHVLQSPATLEDYISINRSTMGSKYFSWRGSSGDNLEAYHRIGETPSIWVGEVSWLKAALTGDGEAFIPSTVEKVNDLIGEEFPTVDQNLIEKIVGAFETPNATGYSLADPGEVRAFLEEHKGKQLFTVSW